MTLDISSLRKMKSATADFAKITDAFTKIANPNSGGSKDDRFWKLEGDAVGNGMAIIRFLPKQAEDDLPWVKIFSYGFKMANGKWFIENSLSTFGERDYIGEENSRLWDTEIEANREIAKARKRKLSYIANILVISDPKHPENNGQVKLFKFGKKIFDKIMEKGQPTFEGEEPIDIFNLWEGCNFRLKQKVVGGFNNYDDSQFDSKSELYDGDEEKLLKVINSQIKLAEFLDRAKHFKTYDEMKAKFLAGMSTESGVAQKTAANSEYDDIVASVEKAAKKAAPEPKKEVKVAPPQADDDEDLAFFRDLANGD